MCCGASCGRPSWTGELVAIGSATDCYQPIEGHYKLTRGALEVLLEHGNPASIVTKGPMIVRDKDLLGALVGGGGQHRLRQRAVRRRGRLRGTGAGHGLSPRQRLRAARELADAGVRVRILMSPMRARALVEAVAHRAHRQCLRRSRRAYRGRQRDAPRRGRPHPLFCLARARAPGAGAGYAKLYRGKNVPAGYTKEVARALGNARAKVSTASAPRTS